MITVNVAIVVGMILLFLGGGMSLTNTYKTLMGYIGVVLLMLSGVAFTIAFVPPTFVGTIQGKNVANPGDKSVVDPPSPLAINPDPAKFVWQGETLTLEEGAIPQDSLQAVLVFIDQNGNTAQQVVSSFSKTLSVPTSTITASVYFQNVEENKTSGSTALQKTD